jgi:hypothetical protein
MMETKHTQGEWITTYGSSTHRGVRTKSGFICFLPKPSHYIGQDERYEKEMEENKADAKLIAASPDLLEACKSLYNDIESWSDIHTDTRELILNAIKKATS